MNTTPTPRRYVDTKVRDMVVGQHVTVPTLHSTFTGDLLHTEALGARTHRLTIGTWDGTTTTVTTSSDYTGSTRDLDAHPYPGDNTAEVQMVWEGEVVATVTPTPSNDYSHARAARTDYDGMVDLEDGYLIRLVVHGVTVAEHQNPTAEVDDPAEDPAEAQDAPTYAIEMHQGHTDREERAYGVVHTEGCRDLRDPEPLGADWRVGVSDLGTDWAMDVEDDQVRLAPCARKLQRPTH